MNIELTDENCIFVELTQEDLNSFGITYEQIEYRNEKARKMLSGIFEKAKEKTNSQNLFNSNMRIDLLPGIPDGCVLIFTPLSKRDKTAFIFETDNINNLIDCARALRFQNENIKSSLYESDGHYRLIISEHSKKAAATLCEFLFAIDSDDLEEDRIKEHMVCLAHENALEILCGN